jgi:hypothetical protein
MTSNANWSAVNGTYAQNFGYAFTTGSSGPFSIDWVNLQLNTSGQTVGAGALTIALRSTTNIMAYSAAAGTTAYAADTVNFTMPTTTSTSFTLNLTAAQLPNLSAFAMQSNTAYALILYAPSVNIGMMRKTGYADGTTNNFYQVTNGFTMLNTFRNNVKYQNNASSDGLNVCPRTGSDVCVRTDRDWGGLSLATPNRLLMLRIVAFDVSNGCGGNSSEPGALMKKSVRTDPWGARPLRGYFR